MARCASLSVTACSAYRHAPRISFAALSQTRSTIAQQRPTAPSRRVGPFVRRSFLLSADAGGSGVLAPSRVAAPTSRRGIARPLRGEAEPQQRAPLAAPTWRRRTVSLPPPSKRPQPSVETPRPGLDRPTRRRPSHGRAGPSEDNKRVVGGNATIHGYQARSFTVVGRLRLFPRQLCQPPPRRISEKASAGTREGGGFRQEIEIGRMG